MKPIKPQNEVRLQEPIDAGCEHHGHHDDEVKATTIMTLVTTTPDRITTIAVANMINGDYDASRGMAFAV